MFESLMNVRYITSKNSFCYLSTSNLKHLQNKYVKLLYNDNESVYVSVESISVSIDDQSIGINSLFAKSLGIEEKSLVAVSEISRPSTIQSVSVTAINDNDHCVLESLADTVQSTLLQQISVLNTGQKFVIWIGKAIHVTVTVCDIKPFSPGIIDNLTEVVIKQPEKHNKVIPKKDQMNSVTDNKRIEIEPTMDFLKEYKDKNENLIFRIVPYKEIIDKIEPLSSPFNVFVFKKMVQNLSDTTATFKIYLAKLLDANSEVKPVYVRLYIFEDILKDFKLTEICSGNVFVSDTIIDHFNCDIGTRILLEPCIINPTEVNEIEIYTKKNYSVDVTECFQNFLAKNCKSNEFILNSDVVMDVTSKLRCFLRFQPSEAKFCYVTKDFVRNFKSLVINETVPHKEKTEESEFNLNKYTTNIANFQEIIDKCSFLFVCNTRAFSKMYNVLITGKSGTGKTTLTKIVSHLINSFPGFIHTKRISCKSVKGKTVESLQKLFSSTFINLIHRQPSVLILDDLHVLCEKVNEGETVAQVAVYFNRVSEMLEGLFKYYCEYNAVGILATAESTAKLNKYVYATRGNHLFKNVYNINHLEKKDRRTLLEFFFSPYVLDNVDLDEFATKSESFVIRDMSDFANKTLFESYHEDYNQSKMKIKTQHCEKALETVTGTSLSGVNLHSPGVRDLDDIGGLADAKRKLVETMLWPAKYPDLFSNAPLRLPSGLLFYGPPGTGKTILAGAAAKHCGLRLISIKGPELLSKYIGASEQAVRDVFQRAQSAKPCILFFDEFDSLAPRRGHDNTGVTDRVVNQLLTQLDGIETLSGVFVLAATSRPDLLDPALLRPGRLDIHIFCPLPDAVSRLEILKILSKSLKLSPDVDLLEVAKATEGFSGADLQSVLYSAQLDSFKGLSSEDENENVEQVHLEICQAQLMEALKNTKPSLTKMEQKRYEEIYRNFQHGMTSGPGTKATLA